MVKTLGIFKRENNECSRNREKTKLHKIKIVVFFFNLSGAMTRISSQITSLWGYIFNVVTMNNRRHTFKKRQNDLYNGKNLKKNFL